MDLAFFRRAERMLVDRAPARLDYDVLVATLAAVQPPTAGLARAPDGAPFTPDHRPLVELLTAGPGWRGAVRLQAGSFNRTLAAAAGDNRKCI